MEYLVLMLLVFGPSREQPDQKLSDFSRMLKAQGESVSMVDQEGTVREGVLVSATADAITMKFAGGDRLFSKATIASAERLRDGNVDGAIKGALFGALMGAIVSSYDSGPTGGIFLKVVATYSGIGWALDASQKHRQPIYRTATPEPTVKVSVRF